MHRTDLSDQELAGRNAGKYPQQALMLYPNADSCLPSEPDVIYRKEGTALLELETSFVNSSKLLARQLSNKRYNE
jgi:hypothetical protein